MDADGSHDGASNTRPCPRCGSEMAGLVCRHCALGLALAAPESDAATEAGEVRASKIFAHFVVEQHPDGSLVELGRGGMGITYKALDRHLRVAVALKVIAPGYAYEPAARQMFLREARAAARIRHWHVGSIVYLHEDPAEIFYAMEFLRGETLQKWMESRTPLAPAAALEIVEQCLLGLGAIHAEGIIHRDLKPANIMMVPARGSSAESLDRRDVKIIDFGLARAVHRGPLSDPSFGFRGTALYASPEQCEESLDLDGRTDLYSVGCILFHLLAGSPPFEAASSRELMNLQVTQPPPLEKLAHLPPLLTDFVGHLLAKDPADRPADAAAALEELRAVRAEVGASPGETAPRASAKAAAARQSSPSSRTPLLRWAAVGLAVLLVLAVLAGMRQPRPQETSVAVLPFSSLSTDPENAFIADGLLDDIITSLSRLKALRVTARSSVAAFPAGLARDPLKIGRQLDVGSYVEGSIRRADQRIKVAVQLVDTATGKSRWGDTFDYAYSDLLAIQGQLALEISTALAAQLGQTEKAALASTPRQSGAAYPLFVRAKTLMAKARMPRQEMDEAALLLEEALEADPKFGLAHAQRSLLHTLFYSYGRDRTEQRLDLARRSAEEAEKFAPQADETLLAWGNYYYRGFKDYERAKPFFNQLLASTPGHAEALAAVGLIDRRQGRWTSALENLQKAGRANPLDVTVQYGIGTTLKFLHRYDEAIAQFDTAIRKIGPEPVLLLERAEVFLKGKCDPGPLRELLFSPTSPKLDPAVEILEKVKYYRFLGHTDQAFGVVRDSTFPLMDGQYVYETRESVQAETLTQAGRRAEARPFWEKVREDMTRMISQRPADPRMHILLAFAEQGCGGKEAALKHGEKAVELCPLSQDAHDGAWFLERFTLLLHRSGENKAKGFAERLLLMPSLMSREYQRLAPEWQ